MKNFPRKLRNLPGFALIAFLVLVSYGFDPVDFSVQQRVALANPGGISADLQLWLKADLGATSALWADQSANGNDATQGAINNQPVVITNALNFNPVVRFDDTVVGQEDWYGLDATQLPLGTTGRNYLFVATPNDVWNEVDTLWHGGTGPGSVVAIGLHTDNSEVHFGGSRNYHELSGYSSPTLYNWSVADSQNTDDFILDINGINVTLTSVNSGPVAINTGSTSGAFLGASQAAEGFNGDIAEVIAYDNQKTGTDLQEIQSYLALKYGITLDQSGGTSDTGASDYLLSDGTKSFDAHTGVFQERYRNDLAGIARDDSSVLDQRMSKSVNSDGVFTLSNGTDPSSPTVFSADLSSLIWGNDGAGSTWVDSNSSNVTDAPSGYQILSRGWRAFEQGTIGTVSIEIDMDDVDFDIPDPTTNYFLISDTDGDFDLSNETPVRMYDDGSNGDQAAADNVYTINTIDLEEGEVFKIATEKKPETVRITEVEYDSVQGGVDSTYEWIELYNYGTEIVDLTGWSVEDAAFNFAYSTAITIPAGGYVVFANNATNFQVNYPLVTPDVDLSPNVGLNNTAELVTLYNSFDEVMDVVAWEGQIAGWNLAAGSDAGESICRINSNMDTDVSADWQMCTSPTPGSGIGEITYISDGSYDISSAIYDSKAFGLITDENFPGELLFNEDGTSLYILEVGGDNVYERVLSSPYDISTALGYSVVLSVDTGVANPVGMMFSDDGMKLYILDSTADNIKEYGLALAHDISTASLNGVVLTVTTEESDPTDMIFNDDGTKLYIVGRDGEDINEYDLSLDYDVSTAAFNSVALSVSAQEIDPTSMMFNHDGTKLYVMGTDGDDVNQYSLDPAYDIGSATFDSVVLSVGTQASLPYDMVYNGNGTGLYVADLSLDDVHEYTLSASDIAFSETATNAGAVEGKLSFSLNGDTFNDPNSDGVLDLSAYSLGNISAGLTSIINLYDADGITSNVTDSAVFGVLTLSGSADDHEDADDVSDITFVFNDTAFNSGEAGSVDRSGDSGAFSTNLGIDFKDGVSLPPTIVEVTAVVTPGANKTPSYTFNTDEAGTITYGGSCTSTNTSAVLGNNIITFDTLADGTYTDCTITVTDIDSDVSNVLDVSDFTIITSSSDTRGGGAVKLICEDSTAVNYDDSGFGRHVESICKYRGDSSVESVVGSGSCSIDLMIAENLKHGARDGQFNFYTGGDATQVSILQAHINRILVTQYDEAAGPVDGIFGPLTKQGVERLQAALNTILQVQPLLAIDGIVGPFTMSAINNSCGVT